MFGGYASPEGLAESEGVDAYGGFGDIDGGAPPGMSLMQHREKARLSIRDIEEAMNKARSRQRELDPITLQQAKGPPMTNLMTPKTSRLDLTNVELDPYKDYTGPIFDHTNSIKDMYDAGYGHMSTLAGLLPGAKTMTAVLNALNLHNLAPYMTEEELSWPDDRWEGGASDGDIIRRLFTPQQGNPHTTDALAYGNAYDMWEGGDQPD
tara:strand:- start:975 stop:1598 length:624 start_codon:yes stop_codon:yes gene_type:complete